MHAGRLSLYSVSGTLDGEESGVWDQNSRQWVELGADFRAPIKQGLRIARKQAAPDLILIPLPAAEGN